MELRGKVPNMFHGPKHRTSSIRLTFLPLPTRVYFLESTNLNWALSAPNITTMFLFHPITSLQFNDFLLLALI